MAERIALVTGASRGIGAAICRVLIEDGFVVFALARKADGLASLRDELGDRLRPVVGDATDVPAIVQSLGDAAVDVLVNNAGALATVRPLHEQSLGETHATVMLNLVAPLQLIQALLPGMVARRRGHIINITSTAGYGVLNGAAAYGASKAGLSQASRALRYELAGSNVRVTDIAPGRVETGFYLAAYQGDAESLARDMFSAQRALRPEDVAHAVRMALTLPEHADISEIVISPTDQAQGGFVFPEYPPER